MRRYSLFIFLALLLVTPHAHAQVGQKIAIVNLQRALNEVDEGKKTMSALEAEKNAKKKELETAAADLEKMRQDLDKQKAVLSKDALQSKLTEMETKYSDLMKKRMDYGQQLATKENDSVGKIIQSLKSIVVDLAKKKGFDIVYENSTETILFANNATDITNDVIQAFNKH
jgi:outer membrane protein